MELNITKNEREYLRELAKRQLEIANLPIMKERTEEWYAHNAFEGKRPMIIIETNTFWPDMQPEKKCESPFARYLEDQMLRNIVQHEKIDDDCICPDFIEIPLSIGAKEFGFDIKMSHSTDANGISLGYDWEHPFEFISEALDKVKPWEFYYDPSDAASKADAANDILGDILPTKLYNNANRWLFAPTQRMVVLFGLENWMMNIIDEPDEHHQLMQYLLDNYTSFVKWQEEQGLLTMNNGNDYIGAGSRGFTHELKAPANGKVTCKDIWINMNSQESYSISPAHYKEFVFPYYKEFAKMFGAVYYGCCEPVHPIWKDCLETLPNLKKVSISAWCDEEIMGEALRGQKVTFSRKPSPNFLGVGHDFDEAGYRDYIKKTLNAARGCSLEFIFRDVYTLTGDQTKPGRAVKILRELIESEWKA